MKKLLLVIWNGIFDAKVKITNGFFLLLDRIYRRMKNSPEVMSIDSTINAVVDGEMSVSRFGDGEAKLVAGVDISFQKADDFAVKKLREVLASDIDNHLVCLPDVFGDISYMDSSSAAHWKKHMSRYRRVWYKYLRDKKKYGNAFMSRCYMMFRDKSACGDLFASLRRIWDGQNILIIEGEKSRLGVGNDLFDNAASIIRILGPVSDAFSKYDELLTEGEKYAGGRLVLLALGPAATGLAFDLCRKGLRAIDIGHVDIEYEWFRSGVAHKTPVKNKFVNEAGAGRGVGECNNEKYLSEIVSRVIDSDADRL